MALTARSTLTGSALRHGLPVAAAAVALAAIPAARAELVASLAGIEQPLLVLASVLLVAAALLVEVAWRPTLRGFATVRLLYFLGVAALEEWIFRVALPELLAPRLSLLAALVLASASFGALHVVTLRYSWRRCAFAALGGFALALLYEATRNFVLITLLHWLSQPRFNAGARRDTVSPEAAKLGQCRPKTGIRAVLQKIT